MSVKICYVGILCNVSCDNKLVMLVLEIRCMMKNIAHTYVLPDAMHTSCLLYVMSAR